MEQNNLILQILQNFDYHFQKYSQNQSGLIKLLFQNYRILNTKFYQSGIFQGYGAIDDKNLNGICVIQYFDGKQFIGEFKNNQRNGYGYCTFCDKCYFKGIYQNDQKVEGNIYKLKDDEIVYEGSWKDDLYNGTGYLKLLCGQTYQGTFTKGHPHGQGVQTFPNGDTYTGQFNYGKRQGKGIFKRQNGEVYEGEFKNDKFDGKGLYKWQNGDFYEGKFFEGQYQTGQMKYSIGIKAQDYNIETPRDQMRVYKSNTFMNMNQLNFCDFQIIFLYKKFLINQFIMQLKIKTQHEVFKRFPYDQNEENASKNQNDQNNLVEFYDNMKDPISVYFMDKMQQTIVDFQKFQQIQPQQKQKKVSSKKKVTTQMPIKFIDQQNDKQSKSKLFDLRRKQKQKEILLNNKVNQVQEESKYNLVDELKDYQQKKTRNRSVIKDQLSKQQDDIQKRLQRRRDKSMNKSIEQSFVKTQNKSVIPSKNQFTEQQQDINIQQNQEKQKKFELKKSQTFQEGFQRGDNILDDLKENNI